MSKIAEVTESLFRSTGSTYVSEKALKKALKVKDLTQVDGFEDLVVRLSNGNYFYTTKEYAHMEKSIAENIARLMYSNPVPKVEENVINALIEEYEQNESAKLGFIYSLDIEQKNAVIMAINNRFCAITGGPGTGKTSVLNCILYVFSRLYPKNKHIMLTAPTGKAAQRIQESSGRPACTIQRLLGASEYGDTPVIIRCDVLNIDEVSMLDTLTAYFSLWAISDDTRVILSGDIEQLPSVEPGAILRDIIGSSVVPTVQLEKTFRQKEGSKLADNIKFLKKGYSGLENGDDFVVDANFNNDTLFDLSLNTYLEARKVYGNKGVCMLTPNKRAGLICADVMNDKLQNILNPDADGITVTIEPNEDNELESPKDMTFKVGDPVMQLKNLYDEPVVNGQIGEIKRVHGEGCYIEFENGYTKEYSLEDMQNLDLAYAMSVHKSQGSEYPCVITCVPDGKNNLLNRNLIYTGVTRSKKKCIIFCKKPVLEAALAVEASYDRLTFLKEEIVKASLKWSYLRDLK